FSFVHILMYFDDQRGIFWSSLLFFLLNIVCTFITMKLKFDGLGMFIASFISLLAVSVRLLYVLRNIDYYTFCSQPIYKKEKRMVKGKKRYSPGAVTALLALSLLLSACSNVQDSTLKELSSTAEAVLVGDASFALTDDKRLYERDQ